MIKLSYKQILEIKELHSEGKKGKDIALKLNVSPPVISYWINDERRQETIKKKKEWFKNKPLDERKKIYQKRKPYLKEYYKKKYNSDSDFKAKEKLRQKAIRNKKKKNEKISFIPKKLSVIDKLWPENL